MLTTLALGLALVQSAEVRTRNVTLGDLVDSRLGPLSSRSRSTTILRLPIGVRRVVLSKVTIVALVKRRSGLIVTAAKDVTIRLLATAPRRGCWASVQGLAPGKTITRADVTATECINVGAVVDDEGGEPTVRFPVGAGVNLGRFVPSATGTVPRHALMTLRSTSGPVVIERSVTTMQRGRAGRSVFVRDGDGRVFAAPLAMASPQ